MGSPKKASYMKAEALLGRVRGVDPEEALDEYLDSVENSSYPSRACLEPHEVEAYLSGHNLPSDRIKHAADCEMCSTLLRAARPSEKGRNEFLDAVRERFSKEEDVEPAFHLETGG